MRLLIVGKLDGQLGNASAIAVKNGARVTHATDAQTALETLRSRGADLLMVDVALDIKAIAAQLKSEHFSIPIVACGIGTEARAAAQAIRDGAKEYIPLPPDAELIAAVLEAVADENDTFIVRDAVTRQVVQLAEQVAPSEASILITGESGTGKEVFARLVHRKSNRAKQTFVSVNCAAIPENLLESELFGHEKGAFTGAVARRIGKFEEADGGTLLLDEVSEMDIRLQAKLLRAIQEREIDRVGGARPVKVNIRIIATSNRDLAEEVKKGTFREDLLFRLNVVNLRVPPLRERPADIEALADYFARKYSDVNAIPFRPLSDGARTLLRAYSWKGNVRELENTLHRAVLLASGDEIGPEAISLPDGTRPQMTAAAEQPQQNDGEMIATGGAPLVGRTVADVERDLIIDTLKHCLGNRTHAANILGISIRTLRNKLNQYQSDGVPVPAPGEGARAAF
ncbi:sigma-54-dependent Fis family transcriptional regulator [Iodidimonas gelatinilytica]|uniref:Sigma-54-dependent Fis family transcriptional regulator n=2 Tax=Iodidimonas TaxID=2066486 RepID=A0A5A7MXQ8_9PROT|nr:MULTISPECIES: sigma-54 dependent transcriptional regulator [Iodidimonas]GEQ98193.1 sigma-54-dependent Fis family transcriptional regulator [Iodidimonas gelatinilytica]GER00648.1 sigma-54-dependent Fis family transcriptional regulator [Iodidimonas gelatinilytica]GER07793.1 sigma-54-dependent Fis family transcriptional regulator [Kordiimonadales bacterium JCM 17843]GGO15139.1 sigma-54-dependent Fis family transcriptional regulator [Iodidimonas muriae]